MRATVMLTTFLRERPGFRLLSCKRVRLLHVNLLQPVVQRAALQLLPSSAPALAAALQLCCMSDHSRNIGHQTRGL